MLPSSRVVWSQGMFLLPQHFQQEARHVDYLLEMRARAAGAHAWGFFELVLDEGLLASGQLAIARASGVLPDGTPFSIPQHDRAPPALEVPADLKQELVYLAIPRMGSGLTQVAFDDVDGRTPVRWIATGEELRDITNAADDPEPIQTGALALRLLRARDAGDGHALLAVARVIERRADGPVLLDREHIPPQTRIDATRQLASLAADLHGLARQRALALAARFGQLGHGVSDMADFLMLQAINRAEPLLRQIAQAPHVHPQELFRTLIAFAGDLAALTTDTRVAPKHPLYRHDDLQACFAPVVADLRRMIGRLIDPHAMQLPLEPAERGAWLAVLPNPDLVRTSNLVLAVNAAVPSEALRARFGPLCKLAPSDRLMALVDGNLPGIGLRLLPTAPRQLPFHAGFHYYELERHGELWKALERSPSLGVHVARELPSLELQLWAIRT